MALHFEGKLLEETRVIVLMTLACVVYLVHRRAWAYDVDPNILTVILRRINLLFEGPYAVESN